MPEPRRTRWYEEGSEPDYRFSLANERTFLAWIRTALAILAGGVVLHQVGLEGVPAWLLRAGSAAVAVLAGAIGLGAYARWRANEIAMRHARPLPQTPLLPLIAALLGILGAAFLALVLVQ